MSNYRVLKDFWYKGKFYQKDQIISLKEDIAKHYLYKKYIKEDVVKTAKEASKTKESKK